MAGVSVRAGEQSGFISGGMGTGLNLVANGDRAGYGNAALDLSFFTDVPNTFKPSDLAGKAFTKPLGLTGVWTVKQVVEHLATATGLTLTAWKPYQDQPVFLGSESLSTGDVMDGLRLALTASWRKMGDAYYLAWDRMTLLAIQQAAREAPADATSEAARRRDAVPESSALIGLVENLPFAEDDPLAPSADQRARLFGPPADGVKPAEALEGIPFAELDADQQRFVSAQAEKSTLDVYSKQGERQQSRQLTEADLADSFLQPGAAIEVSVQISGQGWAKIETADQPLSVSRWELDTARRKAAMADAPAGELPQDMPKELRDLITDPKPVAPPSAVRGLVVPTLGPARLNELAGEMKRHGLNVLFYPALYGGYATFPGTPFPLDPALRGADGLAAAVSAMKPKDIRVVAYLNTLAWQNDEDPVHWLNKHPDWLDVDVLGRGRLQWLKEHPHIRQNVFMGIQRDPYNYVRVAEPQVEARLKALLREVAPRKDVAAVAFAAWRPTSAMSYMNAGLQPPDLGYAWPDRLAAFRKSGEDPADILAEDGYVPETLQRLGVYPQQKPGGLGVARSALLARLLQSAKALRADWRAYLIQDTAAIGEETPDSPPPGAAVPRPDLTISTIFATDSFNIAGKGVLLPVTYKTIGDMTGDQDNSPGSDVMRAAMRDISTMVLFSMVLGSRGPMATNPALPMLLYDFRDAPDLISDSLKWVKAPEK
jgi:hypothetical protein